MNLFVKKSWIAWLILLLCSSCNQEQHVTEKREPAFSSYTLGLITISIPAPWVLRNYDLNSKSADETYVFTNAVQRQDRLFEDVIMVVLKKQKDKPSMKRAQEFFVESMEVNGRNRVKMISFKDTIFNNQELVVIDYDTETLSQNLNQVGTYACCYKSGTLVSIVGLAQRKSREENAKKRALFRKVVYSIR